VLQISHREAPELTQLRNGHMMLFRESKDGSYRRGTVDVAADLLERWLFSSEPTYDIPTRLRMVAQTGHTWEAVKRLAAHDHGKDGNLSALKKTPTLSALVILGDLTIGGNLRAVRSLTEPLRTIMDNGGRRALIPIENKRNFLEVSADIVEQVDPVFYSDPMTAALKALGLK
jgi:ATP-dependent Lon protease